ncbi:hypothetical protein JI749_12575 [Devosia oryziradicis]|uniref:Uncharacterized protein n=1 Tax=Devosia oryziradicis TaxID=2801335 RepID=A0ABX7BZG9_9HYPH|nr:hypothetical protein [Devosia oryziradicis]QQR35201.1 hypothetical protein JI749_12575 [Devosia oryziradicis]
MRIWGPLRRYPLHALHWLQRRSLTVVVVLAGLCWAAAIVVACLLAAAMGEII